MKDKYLILHLAIDFDDHVITSNGVELNIDPKAVEVLEMLVNNEEQTVSIDAFMDKVWASKPSSPEVVTSAIARLRKMFKLAGISEELIVTVHKVGYRYNQLPKPNQPTNILSKPMWATLFILLSALFISLAINISQHLGKPNKLDLSQTSLATINQESASNTTQIYIIRHTEKSNIDREDPVLSDAGIKRANYWREVFKHIDFNRVFTTNFKRNIQTANILSKDLNIKPEIYYPMSFEVLKFINKIQGQKVLIIGHSNTIPDMVNRLIDETRYPPMSHKNYNVMYIITINKNGDTSSSSLHIEMPE